MKMKTSNTVLVSIFMALLLATPTYAALARGAGTSPTLSFTGTTANCSVVIFNGSDTANIKAVISLKKGDDCIRSWEKSAIGYLYFFDTVSVARGHTYTLSVDATVDGKTFPITPVSNTCN